MPLSHGDVKKISDLARLDLTPGELDSFTQQLGSILSYVDKLNELDTSNIEPMSHSVTAIPDGAYVIREDVTKPSLGQQLAVENAPDTEAGFFNVPRVIG
ncbi:MAG TPA: Asp-tRNA(Asn)/Glu-tRNA(Gln) amidotransferase subunit GatC [Blastocatellia bacterium]|nr:Asp-tRNA(Asn)/Glu-tRNA(Gln) amidotransferase subunit GatC [Blastocatellia bacterium]